MPGSINRKSEPQMHMESYESTDLEDQQSEGAAAETKVGSKTWFVLGLLFIMRMAMNWQRKSLSYFYGFQGSGVKQGDPMFEIL